MMPEFVNPFSGLVARKMTKPELIRALRLNLAAELEAVHLYMAHADATDDPLARAVLIDIANEERVHAGEFLEVIRRLDPEEQNFLDEGQGEVRELAASVGAAPSEGSAEAGEQAAAPAMTIGNLREAE
jgi:rubrerythrin